MEDVPQAAVVVALGPVVVAGPAAGAARHRGQSRVGGQAAGVCVTGEASDDGEDEVAARLRTWQLP
ncbi:hypothetical protein GCM10010129_43950 [Streptomyces fumigatiscleroticus]|nr:hypothetical protein GCM10010129_43950 [Streptomyces fumigatiscleroticus]